MKRTLKDSMGEDLYDQYLEEFKGYAFMCGVPFTEMSEDDLKVSLVMQCRLTASAHKDVEQILDGPLCSGVR